MKLTETSKLILVIFVLMSSALLHARGQNVKGEIRGVRGPYYCLMNCATVPGVALGGAYYLENGNARTQILGGGRSEYEARYNTLNKCKQWCAERMQGVLGAYLLGGTVLECSPGKMVCDRGEE